MNELSITQHGVCRLSQRGFSMESIDALLKIGSDIPDGVILTKKDYKEVEFRLKSLLLQLKRLEGKRVVVRDGQIIAAFHATDKQIKRIMRSKREHAL